MKEINNAERKKLLLELLDLIHKYCLENKIIYYLYYGSLIGFIRHNGFIPWDDDIDIAMPREDYENFLSSFSNSSIKISNYRNQKKLWLLQFQNFLMQIQLKQI